MVVGHKADDDAEVDVRRGDWTRARRVRPAAQRQNGLGVRGVNTR